MTTAQKHLFMLTRLLEICEPKHTNTLLLKRQDIRISIMYNTYPDTQTAVGKFVKQFKK